MQQYIEHSAVIRSAVNKKEKSVRPFCQTTGCFYYADYYIVIKETDEPDFYDMIQEQGYKKTKKGFDNEPEFDGFKMILYLCHRHDNDFKYLIRGSELQVAKKCDLRIQELPQDQ
jgi:hypothetical protein